MKKVIGILALIAMTGNIASAELLKNFKAEGIIDVNAYTTNNNTDGNGDTADKTSDVDSRVQLNMGFDMNDDASAVVSVVKNNRQYGEAQENVNTIQAKLVFEQAYMNLKGVLGFDHKLGRQYYGNEGDLVIYYGPTNWPLLPRVGANSMGVTALDSYTGWYKTGKWDIHGVAGKTANNNAVNNIDTDITGVVAKYDLMEEVKLGAYVYEKKTYAATNDLTLDVVGVKANGKFMGFDYYAELAKNYGRQAAGVNYTGQALMANVKYGMDLMGKITFMGEYAMGSGDKDNAKKNKAFQSLASDYRPGFLWGGFNSMAGLNNGGVADTGLTTWNVGAMWNPSKIEKLSLCAKYIALAPTEEKVNGTAIGYDTIGNEFDLAANWKHSENVGVKAYFAYFMPDKDYSTTMGGTDDEAATMLGAAFNVKF